MAKENLDPTNWWKDETPSARAQKGPAGPAEVREWWKSATTVSGPRPVAPRTPLGPEERMDECELDVSADWTVERHEIRVKAPEGKTLIYPVIGAFSGNHFALTVGDKGQDATRFKASPNGKKLMTLGDGVSGTMYGRDAARAATSGAIDHLDRAGTVAGAHSAAARSLDAYRTPDANSEDFHKRITRVANIGLSTASWFVQAGAGQHLSEGTIAATTLDVGIHDPATARLSASLSGDSPLFILRQATGRLETYQEPTNGQLRFVQGGSTEGRPMPVEASLSPGDLFLLASDGLSKEGLEEVLKGKKGTRQVVQALIAHIEKKGVSDDISVVGGIQ